MGTRCTGLAVLFALISGCSASVTGKDTSSHDTASVDVPTVDSSIQDTKTDTDTTTVQDVSIDSASPVDTTVVDAAPEDIASNPIDSSEGNLEDSTAEDSGQNEVVEETTPPLSQLNVFFTGPSAGTTIEINKPFDVVVLTKDLIYGPEALEVTIYSSIEGELVTLKPDFAGWASSIVTLTKPGWHKLKALVTNPAGEEFAEEIEIGLCSFGQPETFDAGMVDPSWKVYGDAYFDNGGWLEMTGNQQGKHGAIYNVGDKVNPGDVELSFKIWTGGGLNTGADGFAMSVINVPSVFELEEIIDMGASGGCLGYGVSGNCGPLTIDSFHIEFDTWKNDGNPNFDPLAANHIAITLDGDPSNHVFWESIQLEDSQWHDVVIKIMGQNITVHFDGAKIIEGDLPAFQFHGGFIGFSGTTGWATNYHRFDDLLVKQECEVP